GVQRTEGIIEELLLVVDSRQARTSKKVILEHLVPHLVHFLYLGEEAVATHVEMISAILGGARETAYQLLSLEHDGKKAEFGELVGRSQAGRPRANNDKVSPRLFFRAHRKAAIRDGEGCTAPTGKIEKSSVRVGTVDYGTSRP